MTQVLMSRMLEAAGHVVTVVGGGEQVLSAITVQDFDVVSVKIDLPEINGFDVAERIRMAGHHDLPIIGFGSDAVIEIAQHCAFASMQSYFAKPVNNTPLQEILCQLAKPPITDGGAAELPRLAGRQHQVPGLSAAARSGNETLWESQIKALRTQAQAVGARRLETLCESGSKIEAGRLANDGKAPADRLPFEVVRVREALEWAS